MPTPKGQTAPTIPTTFAHLLRRATTQHGASLTPVQRQAAIENALSLALWHVRHGDGPMATSKAIGKAIRAASLLKLAAQEGGAA